MRVKTKKEQLKSLAAALVMALFGCVIICFSEFCMPKMASFSVLNSFAGVYTGGNETEEAQPETEEEQTDTEEGVKVRTKQYNIFCTPIDNSNVVFDLSYDRDSYMNRVRCGYHTLPPKPKTHPKFTTMEGLARSCIGCCYTPAGKSPSTGFDCSGFVLYVMRNSGVGITSGSCEGQLAECTVVPNDEARPGDIVFFIGTQNRSTVSHVGIYLGDGMMIHSGSSTGVTISSLSQAYWANHFYCFGRPND